MNNVIGLKIQTISGNIIEVIGKVTHDKITNTYYCAGQSFPAEIVKEVYKDV